MKTLPFFLLVLALFISKTSPPGDFAFPDDEKQQGFYN
jgi:hypothetical protein